MSDVLCWLKVETVNFVVLLTLLIIYICIGLFVFYLFSVYHIDVVFFKQGTTVRVEFGDATTPADSSGAHTISRLLPHTYGQPLVHFLRATAKVLDAQIIRDHPAIR